MKIVVRTKYFGRFVHGQTCKPTTPPFKPYQVLSAQIDFRSGKRSRSQLGCCCHHGGRRVLELTESQFLDAHNGKWNLYHSKCYVKKGSPTHEFYLMPDNQTSINVKAQKGWQLWGSADACMLRMDLEPLFRPFFREKKQSGRVLSHAHIFVLMNVAEDKDPPLQSSHARANRRNNHKQQRTPKEDSSCCGSICTVSTATTTLYSQDSMDHSDHYQELHAVDGPVLPPRQVQCFLGVEEEPAVSCDDIEARAGNTQEQSQMLVPKEDPAAKVGRYLAARSGVNPLGAQSVAPTPPTQWQTPQDFPALAEGSPLSQQWNTKQQDFPVLLSSMKTLSVHEDNAAHHKAPTMEAPGAWQGSDSQRQCARKRVPAAA